MKSLLVLFLADRTNLLGGNDHVLFGAFSLLPCGGFVDDLGGDVQGFGDILEAFVEVFVDVLGIAIVELGRFRGY